MTLKSQVAGVVSEIEKRAEEIPTQVTEARRALTGWGNRMQRIARKNPGRSLIGAFLIGFALAKVARHA